MTRPRDYYESCTQLVPGAAAAYEEFHRAVPRRVDENLRRGGVVSWQIYLRGDVLTHCVGVEDRERMQTILQAEPTSAWWHEQVRPFLVEGASPAVERPLGRLIWDLDWPTREDLEEAGGQTGPFTLGRIGDVGREIPVVRHAGRTLDARPLAPDFDGAFFAGGGLTRLAKALDTLPEIDMEGERIGAPIARPGKIVCIGLNYRDHAEETGADLPAEPVVFMKDPATLVGPFDDVHIPRGSTKTDWEVELGVVIGTTARYLDSPADALAHVAGYAVSHDVSEREFQLERGGQWDKGKSCETFNPFGPDLVPADFVHDPQQLGLRLWVNRELRQDGTTANMLFSVAHVIWYLSQFMVLNPGDVINTGTPAGVALGIPGNPYLREGDVVELEIDGLGRARQRMVQA